MRERRLTIHGNITWPEPLWHIRVADLVGSGIHHYSGDNHVVRDSDSLGLSGGSRREVIELWGRKSADPKIHWNVTCLLQSWSWLLPQLRATR